MDLAALGVHAVALPLIETVPPVNDQGLRHWRTHWPHAHALMFVSGTAVRAFFDAPAITPVAAHTRFWAPGPGTAQALTAVGVSNAAIDTPTLAAEQFDSEALWAVVHTQVQPGHVLVVVGADEGRDWLAQRCEAAGATVHRCVAYTRQAPQPTPDWQQRWAQARQTGCVWLFSSAQALRHLQIMSPASDWSAITAVVTHPRIANAAHALGFGRVWVSRPTLADVLKTLESKQYDR